MKFIKYLGFTILVVIIVKWIIAFLPIEQKSIFSHTEKHSPPPPQQHIKEVKLNLDFKKLEPQIQYEYIQAKNDIKNYIYGQIIKQKAAAKYRLSKGRNNFLEWLFGYFTGWEMIWKKAKGLFGSSDNAVKLVSDRFENYVINPGLNRMLYNINNYTQIRMRTYYRNVMNITINYINNTIYNLKRRGYYNIRITKSSIPWSKYVVKRGGVLIPIPRYLQTLYNFDIITIWEY